MNRSIHNPFTFREWGYKYVMNPAYVTCVCVRYYLESIIYYILNFISPPVHVRTSIYTAKYVNLLSECSNQLWNSNSEATTHRWLGYLGQDQSCDEIPEAQKNTCCFFVFASGIIGLSFPLASSFSLLLLASHM